MLLLLMLIKKKQEGKGKTMNIPYKKYKLGDMIYPIENGTANWFCKMCWGVVYKIDKKEHWKSVRWFYCRDCANLYSEILKGKIK